MLPLVSGGSLAHSRYFDESCACGGLETPALASSFLH
jgi:hypothetical protein